MDDGGGLIMNWRSAMLAMPVFACALCLLHLRARDIERAAIGWLAMLILAAALNMMPMIIGFAGAYRLWPWLTFLPVDCSLAYGPLLYCHARSLMMDKGQSLTPWLFAPFALHLAYQWFTFTGLGSGMADVEAKYAFGRAIHGPYLEPAFATAGAALVAWAIIAVWRMRRSYLEWLAQTRSDDDRFEAAWIGNFIHIAVAMTLVWVLGNAFGAVLDLDYEGAFWGDFFLQCLLLATCIGALANIQQPFPKMPLPAKARPQGEATETPLPRDWRDEGARIASAIETGKWYLEPSLSVDDVARRCATNQAYVSRAINQGQAQSFSQFVNRLRIAHAMELIEGCETEDASDNRALIDIALESGFGSKASFNRAFLTHCGMSPSAWRAQQRRIS